MPPNSWIAVLRIARQRPIVVASIEHANAIAPQQRCHEAPTVGRIGQVRDNVREVPQALLQFAGGAIEQKDIHVPWVPVKPPTATVVPSGDIATA